jgi:hypothetical protein
MQGGRVQSYVRPVGAAHMTAGLMKSADQVPDKLTSSKLRQYLGLFWSRLDRSASHHHHPSQTEDLNP